MRLSQLLEILMHQWEDFDDTARDVLKALMSVAIVTSVIYFFVGVVFGGDGIGTWMQQFSIEFMGVVMTFILFDRFSRQYSDGESESDADTTNPQGRPDAPQGDEALKKQLIREMRSAFNGRAIQAVNLLQSQGWLTDGTLQGAHLEGANLWRADLQNAHLVDVHFMNATLRDANLRNVTLMGANLQGVNLGKSDLSGGQLIGADLSVTKLWGANLSGANLTNANLYQADLGWGTYAAQFSDTTILPDGRFWTPDIDMESFTKTKPTLSLAVHETAP